MDNSFTSSALVHLNTLRAFCSTNESSQYIWSLSQLQSFSAIQFIPTVYIQTPDKHLKWRMQVEQLNWGEWGIRNLSCKNLR